MQILYLLSNWVICLFLVEWWEFFLAIFETLGRNSLPGKSYPAFFMELLPEFHYARTMVFYHQPHSPEPVLCNPPNVKPPTAHKHLSCHHQNLPVALVNFQTRESTEQVFWITTTGSLRLKLSKASFLVLCTLIVIHTDTTACPHGPTASHHQPKMPCVCGRVGFPTHATTPLPLSGDFLNQHGLKLSLCSTSQSSLTEFINQPTSRKCP